MQPDAGSAGSAVMRSFLFLNDSPVRRDLRAGAPPDRTGVIHTEASMKKAFLILRDIVEIYIPVAALLIMFVTFIFQIFSRYILNNPVPWAYEVTVMCYLWMVIFGACFAYRDRSHVTFTLFYDIFGPKAKAVIAFLGNLLMLIAFIYMIPSTITMITDQMSKQVTSVFKISLTVVYFPFIPFMFIIILYILYDLILEFMVFTGIGGEAAVKKMLAEGKSEAEEAIEAAVEASVEERRAFLGALTASGEGREASTAEHKSSSSEQKASSTKQKASNTKQKASNNNKAPAKQYKSSTPRHKASSKNKKRRRKK